MSHSFIKYKTCAMPKWVKYLIREFQPSKVKNYLTAGTPRPKTVGFRDLVGVAIAPVSKKLTVFKYRLQKICLKLSCLRLEIILMQKGTQFLK